MPALFFLYVSQLISFLQLLLAIFFMNSQLIAKPKIVCLCFTSLCFSFFLSFFFAYRASHKFCVCIGGRCLQCCQHYSGDAAAAAPHILHLCREDNLRRPPLRPPLAFTPPHLSICHNGHWLQLPLCFFSVALAASIHILLLLQRNGNTTGEIEVQFVCSN